MNIDEILCLKFPKEASSGRITTLLDENGRMFLSHFDVDGVEFPSEETILAWGKDVEAIKLATATNEAIYKELDSIDLKSIRALREKNLDRLAALDAQAVQLRSKLVRF